MSVPKAKKKKKKGNDFLIRKAERVLKKELKKSYNETASDMSQIAGCLYHFALERAFGFTIEDDLKLEEEVQKLSNEIVEGKITVEEVQAYQKVKGFEFE